MRSKRSKIGTDGNEFTTILKAKSILAEVLIAAVRANLKENGLFFNSVPNAETEFLLSVPETMDVVKASNAR